MVTTDYQSLKYFCDQEDLVDRKARWFKVIQDFNFTIFVDALSCIEKVNVLSFIEIKSNHLAHLRGKYLDDSDFSPYCTNVEYGTNVVNR